MMTTSLNKTLTVWLSSAAGATGVLALGGILLSSRPEPAHAKEPVPVTEPVAAAVAPRRAARPPAPGRVAEPSAAAATPYIGVIVPAQATDVAAPQSGVVQSVEVALGEVVEEGRLLLRLSVEQADLDHERAQAERAEARAALARSRIEREHAEQEARRSELLAREGLATKDELSRARLRLSESRVLSAEAQARLRERSARAEQLAAIAADARVLASFRGRVAARYVDPGTLVSAGTPLLRLISDGAVLARFAIPEREGAVAVGCSVTLVPSEHPEQRFEARVVRLSPEIDAASRMRTVEAEPLEPAGIVDGGLVGALVKVTAGEGACPGAGR